jgi:hypothetical protein
VEVTVVSFEIFMAVVFSVVVLPCQESDITEPIPLSPQFNHEDGNSFFLSYSDIGLQDYMMSQA